MLTTSISNHFFSLLFFYFWSIGLTDAQTIFTDNRDGSKYDIIKIGNYLWFQENLRFVTPTSWCAENPNSTACIDNNFYYPTDLISICPQGWRVAKWTEYKKAIKTIEKYYNLNIEFISGKAPLYKELALDAESISGLTLLNDTTFLNMTATGWIEGDKWKRQNQSNQWIVHSISNTPQPHLHITPERIIMHSHGHNVLDKPKKLRRFSVRCIKCLGD
ncbi:MAG: FISUMP domain-containing protein [Bacteroidota bacterium]